MKAMLKTWQKLVSLQIIYPVSENSDFKSHIELINRMRNPHALITSSCLKLNFLHLREVEKIL